MKGGKNNEPEVEFSVDEEEGPGDWGSGVGGKESSMTLKTTEELIRMRGSDNQNVAKIGRAHV